MTDTEARELNEATARAMGWEYTPPGRDKWDYWEDAHWHNPATCNSTSYSALPDFARDVMAVGYLLAWIYEEVAQVTLTTNTAGAKWEAMVWPIDGGPEYHGVWFSGQTAGEALCRAILAYVEAENSLEKP